MSNFYTKKASKFNVYVFCLVVIFGVFSRHDKVDAQTKKNPNIVLIMVDDLGWADLGSYGNNYIETPHIDRLAERGMKFTNAYAYPVCTPTRAAFLTGQAPVRTNMYNVLKPHRRPWAKLRPPNLVENLPISYVTIAEHLNEHGYISALYGKWHLGYDETHIPENQGFITTSTSSGKKYSYTQDLKKFIAKDSARVNHQSYDDKLTYHKNPGKGTGEITQNAINFIENNKSQSFFLNVSYRAVHGLPEAPKRLIDKYINKTTQETAHINPMYAAMTEALDEAVGYILKSLHENGLNENTLIVLYSDNGGLEHAWTRYIPHTDNSPLRDGKGTLYEGGIRVPLIMTWEGQIPAGSVSNLPVIAYDFYPTFLDVTGIKSKPSQKLDGVSLWPMIQGESKLKRNELYWYYPAYNQNFTPAMAVREGKYKLIHFYEEGHNELYNLKNDISEQHNIASKNPKIVNRLKKKFNIWLEDKGGKLPVLNPLYDPAKANIWGERNYGLR